jgi:glycine/D-amino acid oxidase-like deaminating enzyme
MATPTTTAGAAPASRYAIYWRETEAVDPSPPLDGERRCDVCIVGGGYTGMWTAYFLKQAEPSLDIQIVESDFAGSGASGHADGFITPTIGHSLHTVIRGFGYDKAKAGYAAIGRSILELRRFCRRESIDAELEPTGFHLVATDDDQRRRLEGDVALAAKLGVSYAVLGRDHARDRIGSPAIEAALKTPGALVNPHKLARGLCRVIREQGVTVHERTPATALGRHAGGHVVTSAAGRVLAEKVVLATNAYQHQFAPLRNDVMPVWSYAAVTDPLSDEQLAQVHWPDREGFVEARNFILFGRLTADNRILIGGGPALYHYGRDMDLRRLRNDGVTAALRDALARYFPAWRDVPFSHAYGGCIAITRDLVPHVGALGGGVFYGHGYCGNGIAAAHTAAKALRDLVLGVETDYTDLLFVRPRPPRFPPEPVAFLGARAVSRVLAWQDRHPGIVKRQLI